MPSIELPALDPLTGTLPVRGFVALHVRLPPHSEGITAHAIDGTFAIRRDEFSHLARIMNLLHKLLQWVRPAGDKGEAEMADLKMIVGLGNPGPQYARNRHNLGFQVIDILARRHHIDLNRSQNKARFGDGWISQRHNPDPANPFGGVADRQKVLLVKPITYMNKSGEAVAPLMRYYNVAVENLLVIHDDLDLASAQLRLRPGGGSGGQNGIKSIIRMLGGEQGFARARIGIGRPPGRMNPADYVLQNFSADEEADFGPLRETTADAIEYWLFKGIEAAMNQFNG